MSRPLFLAILPVCLALRPMPAAAQELTPLAERFVAANDVPGMAVAVLRAGEGIVATGVAGVRRRGTDDAIQIDDRFRLGSITKAMTATLAARLVEAGQLSFTTTAAEVFPDLASRFNPRFASATLEQFLSHSAGVPGEELGLDHSGPLPELLGRLQGSGRGQREALAAEVLTWEPVAEPGTPGPYSNAGVSIAAAMMERVTDRAYEDLMVEYVFKPLSMARTHIGAWPPPGDVRTDELALGHRMSNAEAVPPDDSEWYPGTGVENPAGANTFTTLADLGRFVALHLDGLAGADGALPASTIRKLHTPAVSGDRRALGWMIATDQPVYFHAHTGSDGTYFAIAVIYPEASLATIVLVNTGLLPQALGSVLVEIYETYRSPVSNGVDNE